MMMIIFPFSLFLSALTFLSGATRTVCVSEPREMKVEIVYVSQQQI